MKTVRGRSQTIYSKSLSASISYLTKQIGQDPIHRPIQKDLSNITNAKFLINSSAWASEMIKSDAFKSHAGHLDLVTALLKWIFVMNVGFLRIPLCERAVIMRAR